RESFILFAMALIVLKLGDGFLKKLSPALLLVALVNLLGSGSITSSAAAGLFAALLFLRKRSLATLRFWAYAIPLLVIGIGIASLLGWDRLLSFFGRDITLTGRLVAWELAIQMIGDRPVLGYGAADTRFYLFSA